MKKFFAFLCSILFCLGCVGCGAPQKDDQSHRPEDDLQSQQPSGGDETSQPSAGDESSKPSEDGGQAQRCNAAYEAYAEQGYSALFDDPFFTRGFSVKGVDGTESGVLGFPDSTGKPAWTFAQWHTGYDLWDYSQRVFSKEGAAFRCTSKGRTENGVYVPAKVLAADSMNASLFLELNAQVEYDAPRKDGEGWPHTLLSQDFSANLVQVSGLESLVMDMAFTITKFEDWMGAEADDSRHCAQFVWYVTLQNRNRESEGYGEYLWFGLNLWDNRNAGRASSEYAAKDAGKEDATNAFIYQPSSTKFYDTGIVPGVNESRKFSFDLLDTARYAFGLAQARGYLTNTTWEEIYIGSMNFGFENTGTFNVAVEIETVGVYYK